MREIRTHLKTVVHTSFKILKFNSQNYEDLPKNKPMDNFFSPFSIAITSLGEERANLSAFRTFVRFVLV